MVNPILSYDKTHLSKESLIDADKELGETDMNREEKLRELIAWMDVHNMKVYSELWLLYFIRSTKFCVEKAKCKILR